MNIGNKKKAEAAEAMADMAADAAGNADVAWTEDANTAAEDKDFVYDENSYWFPTFMAKVSQTNFATNTTASGTETIQQSTRNKLRKEGIAALKHDLKKLYPDIDIVETKEGIVLVCENDAFTFSWELKSTIKSLDYDPFIEASNFDEANSAKEAKRNEREQAKIAKAKALEAKREEKLKQIKAHKAKSKAKAKDKETAAAAE